MERVASVRAPATVKMSSVSCTKEKKSSAKIGSGPRSTAESSASAAGAASSGPWGMAVKLSKRGKTKFLVGLQGLQESSNARSEPSEGERGGYAGMAWHGAGMKPPGGSASTVAGQSAR